MAGEWFCEIAGKRLGPLSGQQLKALVDDGRLTSGSRVAEGPDGPWIPAGCVEGLFPRAGVRPTTPKKGDLLVATPLDETDPGTQRVKTAPPARKAAPAAVPPAPPTPPAADRFGIIADNSTSRTTAAGSKRSIVADRKRRRKNQVVVVCLLTLAVVVLSAAAVVVIVWENPFADVPGNPTNSSAAEDLGGKSSGSDVQQESTTRSPPLPSNDNEDSDR